jgi:hypothetical protein
MKYDATTVNWQEKIILSLNSSGSNTFNENFNISFHLQNIT